MIKFSSLLSFTFDGLWTNMSVEGENISFMGFNPSMERDIKEIEKFLTETPKPRQKMILPIGCIGQTNIDFYKQRYPNDPTSHFFTITIDGHSRRDYHFKEEEFKKVLLSLIPA